MSSFSFLVRVGAQGQASVGGGGVPDRYRHVRFCRDADAGGLGQRNCLSAGRRSSLIRLGCNCMKSFHVPGHHVGLYALLVLH